MLETSYPNTQAHAVPLSCSMLSYAETFNTADTYAETDSDSITEDNQTIPVITNGRGKVKKTGSIDDNLGTKPKTSMQGKAAIMTKQLYQMMLSGHVMAGHTQTQ